MIGTYVDLRLEQDDRRALQYLNRATRCLKDYYEFKPEDARLQTKIRDFIYNVAVNLSSKRNGLKDAFLTETYQLLTRTNMEQRLPRNGN